MNAMPTPNREPIALHDRAMDNLRFIRETMERAGAFTAVSGAGYVGAGLIGVFAALVADVQPTPGRWLAVWLAAAALAGGVVVAATAWKAARAGERLLAGPGRRLILGFAPPALAAALLTVPLFSAGLHALLPALWLLLYGAAVLTAGAYSVRPVPIMAACFMGLGVVALLVPGAPDLLMALGFGGLHLGFGFLIARRYGG
jgi:hypothetical protein